MRINKNGSNSSKLNRIAKIKSFIDRCLTFNSYKNRRMTIRSDRRRKVQDYDLIVLNFNKAQLLGSIITYKNLSAVVITKLGWAFVNNANKRRKLKFQYKCQILTRK